MHEVSTDALDSRWTDSNDSNTGHSQELKYLHLNMHESHLRVVWNSSWSNLGPDNKPEYSRWSCFPLLDWY